MTRAERLTAALLGVLFLALHVPFLPRSLEDLDSINFALGVRHYDVAQHQPHPPGYPLFIVAAKLLHAAGLSELHALSLLAAIGGALGVSACLPLFIRLDDQDGGRRAAWLGVVMVALCPLFWFTAARPLSDALGLGASLGIQGLLLGASSPAALAVGAFLAAFAAGIRSQVVWLTLPLVLFAAACLPSPARSRGALAALGAYALGGLAWFLPLVLISGGPAAYLRVFYSQGAEDLSGVTMLATTPTARQLVRALQYAFVAPWSEWAIAVVLLVLAAAGLISCAQRGGSTLMRLAVAFGPYLLFDLLFQETITTRYALPLVVPVVYLAYRGALLLPRPAAVLAMASIVAAGAYVSERAISGYSVVEAPAFRLIDDMHAAADPAGAAVATTPVLAMHRRDYFDFRRPFQWAGDLLPQFSLRLAAPPKHEWLEVVKYWNGGGREPVWFIADPPRSDLALFRFSDRPASYRWPFPDTVLVGGSRPDEMDWHVIDAPDWYLGEGWAITPETAGTAREDHKGPAFGGISGWVRRHGDPVTLMVGGRNLAPATSAALRIRVDGEPVLDESIAPGFFLKMIALPSTAGSGDYATVSIASNNPELAVEQFDAQPKGRVIYGFGDGWNEEEYNPSTGVLWRWSSNRSALRVRAEGHALRLTLRGDIEAATSSHVIIRAGDRVAAQFDVGRSFAQTVVIPRDLIAAPEAVLTIESSAFYVPADTKWRSRDRRTLGLKLVECSLTPVS